MNRLLSFPSLIPAKKAELVSTPTPTPVPTPKPRPMPQRGTFNKTALPDTNVAAVVVQTAPVLSRPPIPVHALPPPPPPEPVATASPSVVIPRSVAMASVPKAPSGAGPLWVICAHFNPGRFKKRCTNYTLFMENLLRQNVPVCTVELAASPETAELAALPISTAYKNIYHAVYSPSVLWAKEVLLNIGESLLPPDCRYVCWADADLIWDDDDWAAKAVRHMSKPDGPVVIQPFELCHQMKSGETFEKNYKHLTGEDRMKNVCMPIGRQYTTHPASLIHTSEPFKYHAGYAWVIQRDILNQIGGLFEHCILGQADYCMALAFTHSNERDRGIGNDWNIDGTFNWGQKLLDTIRNWQRRAAEVVKGRLGYLENVRVYHNFHGHPANRQYRNRGRLINDLDPNKDLYKDRSGMLCFTPAAEARGIPKRVVEYFKKRQEDSDKNPNVRLQQ
jgi:hypothetical protein